MHKGKWVFAVVVAALAMGSALYLSGYLTLKLLQLDSRLLRWDSYLGYLRALDLPQVRPYVGRIELAGVIGP